MTCEGEKSGLSNSLIAAPLFHSELPGRVLMSDYLNIGGHHISFRGVFLYILEQLRGYLLPAVCASVD